MFKKKIKNSEELYGELGRAFNFTRGDLEANRAGFLSHRQKVAYRRTVFGGMTDIVVILALVIGSAFLFFLFGFGDVDIVKRLGAAFFVIMVFLVPIGIISLPLIPYIRGSQEVLIGKYEGRVTVSSREEKGMVFYVMVYEDTEMLIRHEASQIVDMQSEYRIFYHAQSKALMSIEALNAKEEN